VVAYGERNAWEKRRRGEGGDREGHRKADRKLLRADTRSQYYRGNREVRARVRAGATHRDPRCAHRTYAEILLHHYRRQLHSLDMARNIVTYRMLLRKTKIIQCNTWDCLDGMRPHILINDTNWTGFGLRLYVTEIWNYTENHLDKIIMTIIISKINCTKTEFCIIIIQ